MVTDLLLCNPYFIKDDPVTRRAMDIYPLLGHGYLASYLASCGAGVELFDATFEKDLSSYIRALDAVKPKIVGIYGHMLSRENAFTFARAAKERGMLTMAGGPDATGYCQDYLGGGFDMVVRGEGEETAREILEWVGAGGDPGRLHTIRGIAYRSPEGHVAVTDMRPYLGDVDALPFPRRDAHVYHPYTAAWKQSHGYVSMSIMGARGCPYGCSFCYRPVFGRMYRRRSPRNILAEIEQCVNQFDATHFRFVDDTFVVYKPWVNELSTLIKARGLRVSFDVLARTNLVTEQVAKDLREMGVRRIHFGMESGSDKVLSHMNKRLTVGDTLRAAEVTKRHGMEFLSWIMLGYPGEQKEDIYLTRDMLVKVRPDIVSISMAFPVRGTAFHDQVKDLISQKRPFWKRTGENRMVWQGRYPDLFYAFARRWLNKEVELAKGAHRPWIRPVHLALKWAYRLGMEALAKLPGPVAAWAAGVPRGAP